MNGITSQLSRLGLSASSALFYLRSPASGPESLRPVISMQLEARPSLPLDHVRAADWASDHRWEDRAQGTQYEDRRRGTERDGGARDGYEGGHLDTSSPQEGSVPHVDRGSVCRVA